MGDRLLGSSLRGMLHGIFKIADKSLSRKGRVTLEAFQVCLVVLYVSFVAGAEARGGAGATCFAIRE